MWGEAPNASSHRAAELMGRAGARDVLVPGAGYGRNARPFLERGMSVTGIEISATAIALARSRLGLHFPIHHGSVAGMPYDTNTYDGVFCHGLLYLLDAAGREKLLRDTHRQLAPGGHLVFTVITKDAPMYGQGTRLGEDWYERAPGVTMYFYDERSVAREFGPYGLVEVSPFTEPSHGGGAFPFFFVVCQKGTSGPGA